MAEHFGDYIIRRTVDSKDWEGKSLLDLPPFKLILGVVEITEREMGIILQLAEAAKDK
jgi:TATA-binding protein-associated factor